MHSNLCHHKPEVVQEEKEILILTVMHLITLKIYATNALMKEDLTLPIILQVDGTFLMLEARHLTLVLVASTLDRPGMLYDEAWEPPTLPRDRAHYAFLLGGRSHDDTAYVVPEAFGIERVILSWRDPQRTLLDIDIIGFERLLPIWRGTIDFARI